MRLYNFPKQLELELEANLDDEDGNLSNNL